MKVMRQNDRWRWLTAGAVAVCLLAFTLLIGLLAWQGVRAFWPQRVDLYSFSQPDGREVRLLGETLEHQPRFPAPADEQGNSGGQVHRYLIKTGNRDWDAPDFRVVYSREAASVSQPKAIMVLQRRSHGQAYGWFVGLREDNDVLTAQDPDALLHQRLAQVQLLLRQANQIRRVEMARVNSQREQLDEQAAKQRAAGHFDLQTESEYQANQAALQRRFDQLSETLASLQQQSLRDVLILRDVHGIDHAIPLTEIVDSWKPNAMTAGEKTVHFLHQLWRFVSDSPADGESESGLFRRFLAPC